MKLLLLSLFLVPSLALAEGLVVATFGADWCGSCKVLEPKVAELKTKFGDNVQFVKFDLTDENTTADSMKVADELGLKSYFEANQGKTGFSGIYSADSKEQLGKLTKTLTVLEMEKEIRSKL